MKYKMTKEQVDAVKSAIESGEINEDGFEIELTGFEDEYVPKAKREIEAEHRKAAEKKLADIEAREARLLKDLEAAKGSKAEIESVRQQYEKEVAQIKEQFAQREKEAKESSHKAMIREEATKFANEKFTVPSAIARMYQDRLTVEEVDGNPVIRVREEDGKPSIKSLLELQQEFLTNKEFAPIIKGTNARGGGASPQGGSNSGGATKQATRSEFDAMPMPERSAFFRQGGEVVDD